MTGTIANPLRFPGQYQDTETALAQNWFRDYDSTIGRYIESDPIGLWGGANTYEYVSSNPLGFYDPWAFATANMLDWQNNPTDLYDWADSFNPTNFNTVVIHGSAGGIFADAPRGGYHYTPEQIADYLRQQPRYNPKLPTLLIACEGGVAGAQRFANELANPHGPGGKPDLNPVYAPLTTIRPQDVMNTGGSHGQPKVFVPFYPGH